METKTSKQQKTKALNIPVVSSSVSFETFKILSSYDISNIKKDAPSSFNGDIEFRKYKVTVEPVDESFEVLSERLQTMWDKCDNFHHCSPLKSAAKSIGYELQGSAGSKRS
jgi:hypothetical protein